MSAGWRGDELASRMNSRWSFQTHSTALQLCEGRENTFTVIELYPTAFDIPLDLIVLFNNNPFPMRNCREVVSE
jgi:hypothetical protein